MAVSRRGFVRAIGVGSTGFLSTSFIVGRGREAATFEPRSTEGPPGPQVHDDGIIKISSNEDARGPGESAYEAIRRAMTPRMGRGYPPDHRQELTDAIAEHFDVEPENVIVGTGSGAILAGGTRAFCSPSKHLVTAGPSYGPPERAAREIGAEARVELGCASASLGDTCVTRSRPVHSTLDRPRWSIQ